MKNAFIAALKSEVLPAFGCTEPTTVALATTVCRDLLSEPCQSINIEVSTHLYKNAMGVYVPGTGLKGLVAAAAAGWVAGDKAAGLQVLHKVDSQSSSTIRELHDSGLIRLHYSEREDVLFTRVRVTTESQSAEVTIEHTHTGISKTLLNGNVLFEANTPTTCYSSKQHCNWSLNEIFEFIAGEPIENLVFIQQAETVNRKLSDEGLHNTYGAAVGRTIKAQYKKGWIADDMLNRAALVTAAASDARMGGASLAAMSNSGSGNQGITATLPVSVVADWLGVTDEQRIRALALSHLVAIYCKQSQYKLSALCAVTTAAMGAAAAICWLLGGTARQLHTSINNMVADVSGMLCDGANAGCALKVSTSTSSAVKAALLAVENQSLSGQGIVAQNADLSIANIGKLSREGLNEADRLVVTML